jgi:hypothetical protein
MSPTKRIPPAGNQGEFAETEFTAVINGTPSFADYEFDKNVVDRVDGSIWRALFDGHFRLVCGYRSAGLR